MTFKFLIDECLSPALAEQAVGAGHGESTCVRDRGWAGLKDWDLMNKVAAGDYTLVTNNARDFRGDGKLERGGLHARQEIHAGLVCLSSARTMNREKQTELFAIVLEQIEAYQDLVNCCLEVIEDEHGEIAVELYELPAFPAGPDAT